MSKAFYIGNSSGKAIKGHQIYVGDSSGKARRVLKGYIGDSNGKARLFYDDSPVSILIKPFSRSLVKWNTSTTDGWVSNDPAVILQHGSMSISGNVISQQVNKGYQIVSYYDMYVVTADGREVNMKDYVDAHTISGSFTDELYLESTGGAWYYNGTTFNAYVFNDSEFYPKHSGTMEPDKVYTNTVSITYDGTTKSDDISFYNNGASLKDKAGCFLYLSVTLKDGGYGISYFRNRVTINSISIDGVSYPVTISTDWGDR